MSQVSDILKETLTTQPAIQKVWLNDEGGWAFHKRDGFNIEMSRDEILASATPKPSKEVATDDANSVEGNTKKSNSKTK